MKPTNTMKRYLEIARKEAQDSDFIKRHGAVLVRGGSVINKSCNSKDFSSFMNRFISRNRCRCTPQATRHAELVCVLGLDKSVTAGATMYVVRLGHKGKFMLSKPCSLCQEVMLFTGVRKVIYTVNEHEVEQIKF